MLYECQHCGIVYTNSYYNKGEIKLCLKCGSHGKLPRPRSLREFGGACLSVCVSNNVFEIGRVVPYGFATGIPMG